MTLLRFDQVALVRGGRRLFEGLDLALEPGAAVQVAGPNGAGKSSLLRLAAARPSDLWRGTLDYLFVDPATRVVDCHLILDRPHPDDPTLYASDHFGLAATLELGDGPEQPRHLTALLTGARESPADLRAKLPEVSPIELVSRISAAQSLIVGSEDHPVMVEQSRLYAQACADAGRPTALHHLDGANHFDVIDPAGAAWPVVADAVSALIGGNTVAAGR